jgi:acyl carrier protein
MTMSENYLNVIKGIVATKAGVEPEEINTNSYIEDDLNIGELEYLEILQELEEYYQIDLIEEKDSIESINDLLGVIVEKVE